MKANYVCSKCGQKATSKCIHQRSLFVDYPHYDCFFVRQMVTTKGNDVIIKLADDLDTSSKIAEYLVYVAETIEKYPEVICSHDWQCVSDTCMFGCCKKE